jgi:DNA-binding transcriptional regulator GbsR (MarR family)
MPKAADRKPDARKHAVTPDRASDRADAALRVRAARAEVLDGVGREIAASFPGITRLGGQVVAALYLADRPLSMDELSAELGRSKSNVFANLRGLEAAGIVERRRASGTRHDTFTLRGKYPDVVVGAYLWRLRRVVVDKVNLCHRSLGLLGDADGPEADALREKLTTLLRKYERFAAVFAEIVPVAEGPVDLEDLIDHVPSAMLGVFASVAKRALGLTPRAKRP